MSIWPSSSCRNFIMWEYELQMTSMFTFILKTTLFGLQFNLDTRKKKSWFKFCSLIWSRDLLKKDMILRWSTIHCQPRMKINTLHDDVNSTYHIDTQSLLLCYILIDRCILVDAHVFLQINSNIEDLRCPKDYSCFGISHLKVENL